MFLFSDLLCLALFALLPSFDEVFLKKTHCNTSKNKKWFQVQIMTFNKKALVEISKISKAKVPPQNHFGF